MKKNSISKLLAACIALYNIPASAGTLQEQTNEVARGAFLISCMYQTGASNIKGLELSLRQYYVDGHTEVWVTVNSTNAGSLYRRNGFLLAPDFNASPLKSEKSAELVLNQNSWLLLMELFKSCYTISTASDLDLSNVILVPVVTPQRPIVTPTINASPSANAPTTP